MWTVSIDCQKTTKKKKKNSLNNKGLHMHIFMYIVIDHTLSKPVHFCSQRSNFQISTYLIWCLILFRCWPFYIFEHFMSGNGLPKPAILSPFFFNFHGALRDAWIISKKMDSWNLTLFGQFEMDSKYQERILYVSTGWLHEENDCMCLRIKTTLRISKSLLSSYSLILCNPTQQLKNNSPLWAV